MQAICYAPEIMACSGPSRRYGPRTPLQTAHLTLLSMAVATSVVSLGVSPWRTRSISGRVSSVFRPAAANSTSAAVNCGRLERNWRGTDTCILSGPCSSPRATPRLMRTIMRLNEIPIVCIICTAHVHGRCELCSTLIRCGGKGHTMSAAQ